MRTWVVGLVAASGCLAAPTTDPSCSVLCIDFEHVVGDTVYDATGRTVVGSLEGAARVDPADGHTGSGLHAYITSSGGGDVLVPKDLVTLGDSLTIEAWVHPFDTAANTRHVVFGNQRCDVFAGGCSEAPSYAFELFQGKPYFVVGVAGGGFDETSDDGPVLAAGRWTHLAVTWDHGDALSFWVDGVERPQTPLTVEPIAAPADYRIGGFEAPPFAPTFEILLDDVKVSNFAKTADQIAASMSGG